MEPSKEDLEQTQQSRPEEKKRRLRLVKLEEQRFHMGKLEDRIAPLWPPLSVNPCQCGRGGRG